MPEPRADTPSVRAAAAAFWSGLTRPSLAGAIGTPLVALACFVIACMLVTPERLAEVDPGYLMENRDDDAAMVVAEAVAVRRGNPDEPMIALIGPSGLRDAVARPEELSRRLSERAGRPVRVHPLFSAGQTWWEAVAIADYLPPDATGVLILNVSPVQAIRASDPLHIHQAMPLPSESYRDEVRRAGLQPPSRTGIYLIDYLNFYVARVPMVGMHLLEGPTSTDTPGPGRPKPMAPVTDADWEPWRKLYEQLTAGYETTLPDNVARLDRLIERINSRTRLTVVLWECPLLPKADPLFGQAGAVYHESIERLASERGAFYWHDTFTAAGLDVQDYVDPAHIRTPHGREAIMQLLVERLGPLLAESAEELP